jgi:4-hydroxy-tetrahydrodipicolinate reductase
MKDSYKVIVWGPGHIGAAALKQALLRPEFDVVGVKVYSEHKHGVDIGELVGLPPVGVTATTDRDAVLALDADCVIFTPRPLDPVANDQDAIDLLASGKNVVTSWNFHYPENRGDNLTARLETACETGQSTVHGTGVHPSFMVERLVMTLSGLMLDVEHIRFVESVDVAQALAGMGPEVVTAVGFGRDPAQFGPDDIGASLAGQYYEDVIAYVGKAQFNADPDEIRIEHDFTGTAVDEDRSFTGLALPPGTASAISHIHRGYIGDHHFFTNEEHWYLGKDHRYLGAGSVPLGDGFSGSSHYIIELDGKPARIAVQMDLESTMSDETPIITYCSVVTLLQAVISVTHADPGIMMQNARPHFMSDFRRLAPTETTALR